MPPSASLDLPRNQPFDYVLLSDRLRNYAATRDKIGRLLAQGEVIRVKKGLYVPGGSLAIHPVDPLVLSGLVSGPSCVSFEKALELHGLIPERVEEITCATTRRKREFNTPAGRFSYHPVPLAVFAAETERVEAAGGHYFLATAERALCDCAARAPGLEKMTDIKPWLHEDLRLTDALPGSLDSEIMEALAGIYHRRAVTLLARWLKREKSEASAPHAA